MVFPTEYDDSSSEPIKTNSLRYSEIKGRIKEITSQKISDTTLSSRLNELDDNRIVYREQFNQIPPRVEYQLSSKGIELRNSLQPLIEWAIKDCHEA
jgi:DNA-binding HxlR family transcriptional regulator